MVAMDGEKKSVVPNVVGQPNQGKRYPSAADCCQRIFMTVLVAPLAARRAGQHGLFPIDFFVLYT
jgi:hypothetical protein